MAMGRWGGLGGLAMSLLVPAVYRYFQRRRHTARTMPGYTGNPEYAAPVTR
jgi:hypothetical protein